MKRCLAGLFLAAVSRLGAAEEIIYPRAAGAATGSGAAPGLPGWTTALAVIALAGAGGWLLWRRRPGPGRGAAPRNLSVAETRALGNRQYLVVAAYGREKFLIGVCPGQMNLLAKLDLGKEGDLR